MASRSANLPKMMIAFVVRRCTAALGREPTAAELASWANAGGRGSRSISLFGRAISEREAEIILNNRGRLVTAKMALGGDAGALSPDPVAAGSLPANVVPLSAARRAARRRGGEIQRSRRRASSRH